MNTGLLLQYIVFFSFAAILVFASLMVITARNPVRGVLFLVLCFVATAALWILLHAAFLGLILILVYVGAVMTLFLFVVMMLNIDTAPLQQGFVRYLPLGVLVFAILLALMIWVVMPSHFRFVNHVASEIQEPANYNNIAAVGIVLFEQYSLAFELAGVLLLVAMISAISLAFRGPRPGSKSQKVAQQLKANKQQRLKIIKMQDDNKKGGAQ